MVVYKAFIIILQSQMNKIFYLVLVGLGPK